MVTPADTTTQTAVATEQLTRATQPHNMEERSPVACAAVRVGGALGGDLFYFSSIHLHDLWGFCAHVLL